MEKKRFIINSVRWGFGAIAMASLYYLAFSLIFNTDTEERLARENSAYEKEYARLKESHRLLTDEISYLQLRDDQIYEQIFHAKAPKVDPAGILVADTLLMSGDYGSIVLSSGSRLGRIADKAATVEGALRQALTLLKNDTIPPQGLPVKDFSYVVTGASTGMRYNPFYKVEARHDGLDIIVSQGDPVYATADGVVAIVKRSAKGDGNQVVIDHGNGYFTKYAHLGNITVSKGRRVKCGEVIAEAGISGKSFAPHLHYEVLRGDTPLDPVNYMFAALDPEEYAGVAYTAKHTGQSLD